MPAIFVRPAEKVLDLPCVAPVSEKVPELVVELPEQVASEDSVTETESELSDIAESSYDPELLARLMSD